MVPADQADLLVVAVEATTVAPLLEAMRAQDVVADLAHDLGSARQAFIERGGQRLLVFAPDVTPAVASNIAADLRAVDPGMGIVVFSDDQLRSWQGTGLVRIASYHPGSRAGAGALLKLVRGS